MALAGCKGPQQEATDDTQGGAPAADSAAPSADIQSALTHADRLEGDADEDAWRKADAVLALLDAQPGATVLDYFSAGGYYTELLSHLVGPEGRVIAYNNAPYLAFAGDKPAQRYADDRLPNVTQITTPPEELALEPDSLDGILFVDSYHDLYWRPEDASTWSPVDPKTALSRLMPALKPGGTVVVVDHVANAGGDPTAVVDALHRIDPEVVKRDFAAAGLTFAGSSDALSHPQDDHTKYVMDPAVRHQTDQMIYKFTKPH